MNQDEALALVNRIWPEELRRRREEFAKIVGSIHGTYAANGISGGPLISPVQQACLAEIRLRADLVSDVIHRVVVGAKARLDGPSLRSLHSNVRNLVYQDVDAAYRDVLHIVGVAEKREHDAMLGLAHREVEAINQQEAEMDLLAHQLESGTATSGSVNVHGDVYGSIQTGHGSTATVNIDRNSEAIAQLLAAISALKKELEHSRAGSESALALAIDLEREASSAKPDASRLKTIFGALANTVGLLANMPEAWHVVRLAALALLGPPG